MINSGAQGSFMHQEFAVTNKVPMHPMQNLVCLNSIDGTPNDVGSLTRYTVFDVAIDRCIIPTVFCVTNISAFDVILGISWLQCHSPHIDWKDGNFSLPKLTCKGQCKGNLDEVEANVRDTEEQLISDDSVPEPFVQILANCQAQHQWKAK
jgi:hypothetical protein